jgi:PAS domain-containing protein
LLAEQVRVAPVGEDAHVSHLIWMHTDITVRQEQERLLQLRNRALNYMSDGIFIADPSGAIMYTNQGFTKLTGYEQPEAVGQPWTFLLVRIC